MPSQWTSSVSLQFLSFCTQLYVSLCQLVGRSVCPSVGPSHTLFCFVFLHFGTFNDILRHFETFQASFARFCNFWKKNCCCSLYKTRPDTLPGISRVGWAGAVMLKNRREKKGRMDRRTDRPTNQPMDTPSYRVAWTRLKRDDTTEIWSCNLPANSPVA